MELMLRFCDNWVVASELVRRSLGEGDVLTEDLRTTSSVFLPALLVVGGRAPHPRDLEKLPQLDTRFGQSLA